MPTRTLTGIAVWWLIGLAAVCPVRAQSPDPPETIRIETDLVNLNVSILSRDASRPATALQQREFAVFEGGAAQEISFFASAEAPFDLVLLVDLSGSTVEKISLIRKSSKGFVDAARPGDRIAVATFADDIQIVSPLTSDHQAVKKAIDRIEKPSGGTRFWDALRFVLEHVAVQSRKESRRSAIVVMTDGVDNALPDVAGEGSRADFAELVEVVRRWDTIVLPVYLDTERESTGNYGTPRAAFALARQQLTQLAEESGNVVYRARKVKDLEGAYAQVIHDLSTVYSIGYRPANQTRDGLWRVVEVQVAGHPELVVRAKRGYYAQVSSKQ